MIPLNGIVQQSTWKVDLPGSIWLGNVASYEQIRCKLLVNVGVGSSLTKSLQASVPYLGLSDRVVIKCKRNTLC